ncbi:hypothetical protein G6F37_002176 [Rhizopus arrhizus]|nr:hypothetical protein G6F38_002372 [Rhizopus arrhizus]KAG1162419.1 hypothetical protein G6F37_002176 [Rhizopus arrhizus]
MVRVSRNLYREAYEYIKEDSAQGNCIVFVSADVDSLCAALILQNLLKADMVAYKLVPVSSYKDLERAKEQLVIKDEDLVSIFMINCGGLIDAREFFEIEDFTKIYIVDSHRPLNLSNVDPRNLQVCVFDDDDDTERFDRVLDAYEAVTYNSESDSNDDTDNTDDESLDYRSKRRKLDKEREIHKTSRHKKREQRALLAGYYTIGSYHANSSAAILYELANQLSKSNNDLLWFAITGITAQYLYERIDTKKYIESIKIFRDDTARFNVNRGDEVSASDDGGGINIEDEYRFIFKLEQCRQIYAHMDINLKNRLRAKIEEVSPHYGLTELSYPSFTRCYGSTCTLSASDMVYAISAMLETSPATAVRLGQGTNTSENKEWKELPINNTDDEEVNRESHRWWMKNFYQAHDALSKNSPDAVLRGIHLSMETQQAIARQVSAAIGKRVFRRYKTFRFLAINGGPELPMLQHPLALHRLALFTSDVYRASATRQSPLIIASLDEEHNSYLLVSFTGALMFGDIKRNSFAIAFQEIANTTSLSVSLEAIEPTVLYMKKDDLPHFIHKLNTMPL